MRYLGCVTELKFIERAIKTVYLNSTGAAMFHVEQTKGDTLRHGVPSEANHR